MTDRGNEALAELAGRSVVVTGGAGFIGSRLARTLAAVCEVTVVDDCSNGDPAAVPESATLIRGDVRDVEPVQRACAEADVVFHQAAMSDVTRSVRAPGECHTRNASGAMTVLDAARRTDARVVFASSAAVYGPPERLPVREGHPKRPTSPYGVSKLAGDQYARVFAERYGLPTVALRYFNVYGDRPGGGSDVVTQFLERARRGDPLVVHGDGSQTRDFVHVDDVVQANLRAAVTDATGRAYNVATGEATAVRDLAALVRAATDTESGVTARPTRSADIERSRGAVARARNQLGFEAAVGLREGIAALADGESPTARSGRP